MSRFLLSNLRPVTSAGNQTYTTWAEAKKFSEIPGPKPNLIFGNTWRFLPKIGEYYIAREDINEFFKKIRDGYGDVVRIDRIVGRVNMVYLFNPSDIEKVYKSENVPDRELFASVSHFRQCKRQDIFKDASGLLTSQGQDWYNFRNKVNSIMMQPKTIKRYLNPINEISAVFIDKLRQIRGTDKRIPVDFSKEINKWALESISYIALDLRLNCMSNNLPKDSLPNRLIKINQEILDYINKLDFGVSVWKYIPTPTYKRAMVLYDEQVKLAEILIREGMKAIEEKKKLNIDDSNEKELSVLEKLLKIDVKIAIVMTLDMLLAGVDTTSTALINALYYLSINPDKQTILRNEISGLLPEKESKLTNELLEKMSYLKACLKESGRMYAVTPGTMRILTKDTVIAGYQIPKGTNVLFPHMYLSVMEENFTRPKEFIPERWLRSQIDSELSYKNAHPFSSMQFGFGPRSCIGRRFAELELEVFLVNFMRNYNVSWEGPPIKRGIAGINQIKPPYNFIFDDLHGENNKYILN